MGQIRLTPEQLREKGGQYQEQSGIIEGDYSKLRQTSGGATRSA